MHLPKTSSVTGFKALTAVFDHDDRTHMHEKDVHATLGTNRPSGKAKTEINGKRVQPMGESDKIYEEEAPCRGGTG